MKSNLIRFLLLVITISLFACSNPTKGEITTSNTYADSLEDNKTYFIVSAIKWSGNDPITIESVELVKEKDKPILPNEDGISYKFYGASPEKKEGVYRQSDIGDLKDINGIKIDGEGRIVFEFSLNNVSEDPNRRLKVKYNVKGISKETTIEIDTYKQLQSIN